MSDFPKVMDPEQVGQYDALTNAGGGYVWHEVLEYRVWFSPRKGTSDACEGDDYFYAFADAESALACAQENPGSEEPLALILQREYIDEPEPGQYRHVKEQRITEWPLVFLSRPRCNDNTIPNFFAAEAPDNRLDIIRGLTD